MPKQKQMIPIHSQQVPYYVGRVLQRLSLLLAAGSTVVLWGSLLAIVHGFVFANSLQNESMNHIVELSLGVSKEASRLTHIAMGLSVIALALTVALLIFPRVVKYEKRMVVDGATIASFLFITAAFSKPILQSILSHVTG